MLLSSLDFSMARVYVELKKKLSEFAQNFPTYTGVYTLSAIFQDRSCLLWNPLIHSDYYLPEARPGRNSGNNQARNYIFFWAGPGCA